MGYFSNVSMDYLRQKSDHPAAIAAEKPGIISRASGRFRQESNIARDVRRALANAPDSARGQYKIPGVYGHRYERQAPPIDSYALATKDVTTYNQAPRLILEIREDPMHPSCSLHTKDGRVELGPSRLLGNRGN